LIRSVSRADKVFKNFGSLSFFKAVSLDDLT